MQDLRAVIQIQPRKHVLDRVGFTAFTRQHELQYIVQIGNLSSLKDLVHELYDLSNVWEFLPERRCNEELVWTLSTLSLIHI